MSQIHYHNPTQWKTKNQTVLKIIILKPKKKYEPQHTMLCLGKSYLVQPYLFSTEKEDSLIRTCSPRNYLFLIHPQT